jgi:outer membrane protein OmpA-like peptidoglycan-associated protein
MMKKLLTASSLAALLIAGACTTTDSMTGEVRSNRAGTGAIIGAIAGGAAGTMAGGNDTRNAAIGAAIGGLAGYAIGDYMNKQQAELENQMARSGVGIVREGDNIRLNMPSDITFDTDRSDIKGSFEDTLAKVASTLQKYPKTTIDVIGHADSTGADDYNMALSERRARSVAGFLVANGVMDQRIWTQGRGETQPIASNDTAEGRAKNRRVEILLRPVTAS